MLNRLLLIVAICQCAVPALAVTYQIHDLGAIGDDYASYALDINNNGEIVGDSWSATTPGLWHPFVWRNGTMTELPTDGNGGAARGINDAGQIVGSSGGVGACLWQNGETIGLGTGAASMAWAVNENGVIVGDTMGTSAWVWQNGDVTPVGTIGDAVQIMLTAINDRGQVVGYTDNAAHNHRTGFVWENGTISEIPGLSDVSEVRGINNDGQIVGTAPQAFVWHDGVTNYLGGLPNVVWPSASWATAINNRGQVVGYALTDDLHYHATVWQDGTITDLGTLGGWDSKAWAINDNGWIVGFSATGSTEHACLWIPVPEPSCMLSLMLSLAGYGTFATAAARCRRQ